MPELFIHVRGFSERANQMSRRLDILNRKPEILTWISEKRTKAYICEQLKCKLVTLNSYLDKMGIVYEGQMYRNTGKLNPYIPAKNYLGTGKRINTNKPVSYTHLTLPTKA